MGNKSDLPSNVEFSKAESFAKQIGAKHFEVSAKENRNIDELFKDIALSL